MFSLWLSLVALPITGPSAAVAGETSQPQPRIELLGSWYVLIHYRSQARGEPELSQWDDRVWRFERRGTQLRWSELPSPLFADESGRFEALESGRSARTLGFWEPNAAQRLEIGRGVATSRLGVRGKGLRGSERAGYRSAQSPRAQSASVVGYSESWRIEGLLDLPVFTQEAQMRSARTDGLQGVTRYEVREIRNAGDELRGRYQRDGIRSGQFRLLRMPSRRRV